MWHSLDLNLVSSDICFTFVSSTIFFPSLILIYLRQKSKTKVNMTFITIIIVFRIIFVFLWRQVGLLFYIFMSKLKHSNASIVDNHNARDWVSDSRHGVCDVLVWDLWICIIINLCFELISKHKFECIEWKLCCRAIYKINVFQT